MNRYSFFFLFFLFFVNSQLRSQDYQNAVGARLGYPFSASYKHYLTDANAFEVTLGSWGNNSRYYSYRWYAASVGYLIHKPLNLNINGLEELKWYYGGGAAVYFWRWNYDRTYIDDRYASTSFGIQGYLGLEYTFKNEPVNITLDWTPTLALNGFGAGLGGGFAGLGVRYVLNR